MQKKEIPNLALKLAGIYVLVQAILYLPSVALIFQMMKETRNANAGSFTVLITFLLLLILGFWLTFKTKSVAETQEDSSADLISLGLIVGGVIIFALAIGDFPFFISKLIYMSTSSTPLEIISPDNSMNNVMKLVGNLIQLVLGALLFFKANYFRKLIK